MPRRNRGGKSPDYQDERDSRRLRAALALPLEQWPDTSRRSAGQADRGERGAGAEARK